MRSRKTHRGLTLLAAVAMVVATMLGVIPRADAGTNNGTTLKATVSAGITYTKTFNWTIDKSVSPSSLDLFQGDSAAVQYTIAVTKDNGTLSVPTLNGSVCVTNGGAIATQGLSIKINVTNPPSTTNLLTSPLPVGVSAHPILAVGESYCYPYTIPSSLPLVAGKTYKVTPSVQITNHSNYLGTPYGPSPSASLVFTGVPALINNSINVDDTNGQSFPFNASGSTNYSATFTCNDDQGTHDNTATIRQTGQNDSASVSVNCNVLGVSKTAETSFTRTYGWTIDKSVDPAVLNLETGQSGNASYTVSLTKDSGADSNFGVSGTITVHNPAAIAATINSVTDVMDNGDAPVPSCGVSFPYVLAAGADLTCTYSQSLADNTSGNNTATATLQNYSYAADGTATASGTTDFASDAVPYAFGDPTTLVNDSVNVEDVADNGNSSLGSYNHSDTITYSRTFTCDSDKGTHDNTATVYGDGGAALGNSSAEVAVKCTSPVTVTPTPQYWCSPGFWSQNASGLIGSSYDISGLLSTPYSSIGGVPLKVGAPSNPTIGDVLNAGPSVYGGPAFNSVANWIGAQFGWTGTQSTGENCPIDAHGQWKTGS